MKTFKFINSLMQILSQLTLQLNSYIQIMMQKPKTGKRGRPANKKDDIEEEQSQEYSHLPKKKSMSKKSEIKKELKTKKQKSRVELSSVDSFSDSEAGEKKTFKVPVDIFHSDKVYNDILVKANKQPEFLIMLKNLLSGCSRLREDKKSQYRKKWKLLRNSNYTQNQYLSRQNQLKRMQTQEIREIEDDIISKLALANIRGFETKEEIVNNYKLSQQNINQNIQYVIDEGQWNKYRQEQKKLLQILMNQNDFVSQDYKMINVNAKYTNQTQPNNTGNKEEENQMEVKFNNLETQENQESIQFLFCKNYNNINYDKVFDVSFPFKISEDEKYMIDSKAMSWLLESKCDQIYTNEQFQKETYAQYSKILMEMYNNPQKYSDTEIMNNVLEAGAYILNSVHYYQKFKLKCDLLHPLDLLLVAEKITGQRNKRFNTKQNMEPEQMINQNNRKQSNAMIDQKYQQSY